MQPGLPPWSTKWGARLTDVELTPAPTVLMDPAAVAKAAPGALVDPSDNVTQARLEEVLTKLTTVPCRGQIKEDVPDGFRIQLVVTCSCDCVCVSVHVFNSGCVYTCFIICRPSSPRPWVLCLLTQPCKRHVTSKFHTLAMMLASGAATSTKVCAASPASLSLSSVVTSPPLPPSPCSVYLIRRAFGFTTPGVTYVDDSKVDAAAKRIQALTRGAFTRRVATVVGSSALAADVRVRVLEV